jgi:hypothetical protein
MAAVNVTLRTYGRALSPSASPGKERQCLSLAALWIHRSASIPTSHNSEYWGAQRRVGRERITATLLVHNAQMPSQGAEGGARTHLSTHARTHTHICRPWINIYRHSKLIPPPANHVALRTPCLLDYVGPHIPGMGNPGLIFPNSWT